MTTQKELTTQPVSLGKRILQGAGIALTLIILLLLQVSKPDPAWGQWWMIRPLIIVPLAGSLGGAVYYATGLLRFQGAWGKAFAIILGLIGYLFVLWVGTILGLDGTLWD